MDNKTAKALLFELEGKRNKAGGERKGRLRHKLQDALETDALPIIRAQDATIEKLAAALRELLESRKPPHSAPACKALTWEKWSFQGAAQNCSVCVARAALKEVDQGREG